MEGIDVSRYQKEIDWSAVRDSGIAFAYVKATEGTRLVDPYLARNLAGARQAGIPVGVYHFARPGDPVAQARFFRTTVSGPVDLPWALDIEVDVDDPASFVDRFVAELAAHGLRAIVYTYLAYWRQHLSGTRHRLWIAAYRSAQPSVPGMEVWQYTSSGSVPGIQGRVDRNRYVGRDFTAFVGRRLGDPHQGDPHHDFRKEVLADMPMRAVAKQSNPTLQYAVGPRGLIPVGSVAQLRRYAAVGLVAADERGNPLPPVILPDAEVDAIGLAT